MLLVEGTIAALTSRLANHSLAVYPDIADRGSAR